jgi:subtilisin family serine protease
MTTPSQSRNLRFWEQLHEVNMTAPEWVREAVLDEDDVIAAGPQGAGEDPGIAPDYAYLKQHILVRDDLVGDVRDEMARQDPGREYPGPGVLPETRLLGDPVETGVRRLHIGRGQDVHDTLNRLRSFNERLDRPVVTHDYLVGITGDDGVSICPAGEPLPAGAMPVPAIRGTNAGHGVKVLVIDTGLLFDVTNEHPWMANVGGDERQRERDHEGPLRLYFGHGTFIAGVLKCVAPGAEVIVSNELSAWAGAELDSRLGGLILDAVDRHYGDEWPDIISLSAGTSTLNDLQLMGFQRLLRALAEPEHGHTVLVAAAGNDGRDRPFWPAAYAGSFPEPVPGVVSVGALRADGLGRACFSNHGDWVRMFAPGERLVNAFPRGWYKYVHTHRTTCRHEPPLYPGCTCISEYQKDNLAYFDGMAQWSGTSFATPVVAGLIAARTSQTDESAREAAETLMGSALPVSDLSSFLPMAVPEKPMPEPS